MKKVVLLFFCLLFLTGCNTNPLTNSNNDKLNSEIEYISTQIANLLNKLNNISLENYELISDKVSISENSDSKDKMISKGESSQSSSGEDSKENGNDNKTISVTDLQNNSVLNVNTENIDWNIIKQNIELINTSWSIIVIDLNENGVSKEIITNFSELLNEVILNIKNEDKFLTLTNLTNLYSYIPEFLSVISTDSVKQIIENTKSSVYKAYSYASQNDWDNASEFLLNAETIFLDLVNDVDYSKEYKTNKIYLLLKDTQNSISKHDKSLFFLKYKNLIESLNTL